MTLFQIFIVCVTITTGSTQLLDYTNYLGNGQCRQGWTYMEGACYVYADVVATWAEAQSICSSSESKLIEVERSSLNYYLKRVAMQRGAECVWLGGSDIFKQLFPFGISWSGNWKWVSTGRPMYEFQDWVIGQPNNHGSGDYCLALSQRVAYQWNVYPCSYKCKFFCQSRS